MCESLGDVSSRRGRYVEQHHTLVLFIIANDYSGCEGKILDKWVCKQGGPICFL